LSVTDDLNNKRVQSHLAEKVRAKNVTELRSMTFFPQNSCVYSNYVLFQDSAKWDSAKRVSAKWKDTD